MGQDGPKLAQDGPKLAQDRAKMGQDGRKMIQDGQWENALRAAETRSFSIGLAEGQQLHNIFTPALIVQAAAERAPATVEESMQVLVRSVEQGRCSADDFADRAVAHGIAGAVRVLAHAEM